MSNFRNLMVYQKAFKLAMDIFNLTIAFPEAEKYGLTSQIRRSSRSICSCVAEAYRKRKYPAHFISKITDADMENSETQVWLDFALSCKYIDKKLYQDFKDRSDEVGKMLNHMIENPGKYA